MIRIWQIAGRWSARWAAIMRRPPLRLTGVQIGQQVTIGPQCEIALGATGARRGKISIGDQTVLARGVLLHPYGGRIEIGRETHVGPYSVFYGHGGLTVGSHCLIGPNCRLFSSEHQIPSIGRLICYEPDVWLPTKIGSDVWLGGGVSVLGGVTIGDGCVVGAGAVVTRDLPPHSIAHGVPARVQGSRPARESK